MTQQELLEALKQAVRIMEGTEGQLRPMSLVDRIQWSECGWDYRIGDLAIIDLRKRRFEAMHDFEERQVPQFPCKESSLLAFGMDMIQANKYNERPHR